MLIITIIFLLAMALYFTQIVIFGIGAKKQFPKIKEEDELPVATIIVAARNEEKNILSCLESLNELEYPEGKLEIIIVNDQSTDNTGTIINDFISGKPKFKTIIPAGSIGKLKGKTNALANAIKIAQGEIILTTDADCSVPKKWAKTTASYFTKDVGMVCGFTIQQGKSPFDEMQGIDFMFLLGLAAGAMNYGKPMNCIGNNMAYRKTAYEATGGYENIPFSITEDSKLLTCIHNLKKYKIVFPMDPEMLVHSKPLQTMKEIFWQKKRWGVGGMDSEIYGFATLASGYVAKICMLLTPFFFAPPTFYLSLFKVCVDYFYVKEIYKKFNLELRFRNFAAFEIYFIIYVLLLPFVVLPNRKVVWKGREF